MLKLFTVVTLLALGLQAQEKLPTKISIGFDENPGRLVAERAVAKIAKRLGQELALEVETKVLPGSHDLIQLLQEEKLDFSFLTPKPFVDAEEKIGLKVLLKKVWEGPFYYSVIWVGSKSKIKMPRDLKGKNIGLVGSDSTSGFLYPKALFKKMGIKDSDFKNIVLSGSHQQSVTLLQDSKVDAIAVYSNNEEGKAGAWQQFSNKGLNFQVRKIWTSDPIPNDPFCVRRKFYDEHPKLVHSLMFALIDVYDSLQDDPDVKSYFGNKSLAPATSRQYDSVRDMAKVLGM